MQDDYHSVYDEDLSLCDKIVEDVAKQYGYEIAGCQQMMVGGEATRMQEVECEELSDITDQQNCQIM